MGGLGQRVIESDYWDGAETAPSRGPTSGGPSSGRNGARGDELFGADARKGFAGLVRTLDVEIIPRLVLARRASPGCASPDDEAGRPLLQREDVGVFARIVLEQDVGDVSAYVGAMVTRGVALETVFLELLAPTARCLGEMWDEDLCDFTQVTVGLWRLQQVVRELSPSFHTELDPHESDHRRALLLPAQGEQHTFGLFMVAEFLRRAGWDVAAGPVASGAEMLGLVRNEWFAIVGMSVSCDVRLDGLAASIHAVRRASRNRAIGVMVGGPIFVERPELVALVGADASAVDGRQAALQAESLLAILARRA